LQDQLAKAQADVARLRPLAERARHMPITTSIEKLHGGKSFTLTVKNEYLQPLHVDIVISRGGTKHPQANVIEGGGSLTLEKLAGGDILEISNPDFDTVKFTVK